MCILRHFIFRECGCVWDGAGRVLDLAGTRGLLLLGVTDSYSTTHGLKTSRILSSV